MFLTHALRAIYRAVVAAVTGDALWKYVTLLISGTPPAVTFISDASTNGNVLTLNGDTRPSNFNPYTPGYYSNFFDGTGDYLSVPANTALDFRTVDFTIELWVYSPVGFANFADAVISKGPPGDVTYSSWDLQGSGTSGNLRFLGPFSTEYFVTTSQPWLTGWAHIAICRSGSSTKLFVNGTQQGSTYSGTQDFTAGYPVIIGAGFYDPPGRGSNCFISNVRLVKGTAVYTANFTPSTAPLTAIANTSLLTCQSNRFIDNSLNNFAITKNGDTTVSGFAPFTPPTSVTVNNLYSTYFDGTGDWLTVPSNAALNFGTGDFTIEAWVYPNSLAADWFITSGTGTGGLFFGYRQPTGGYGWGRTGVAWDYSVASGTSSVWQHVALTRSGTSMRLFVNGTQVGTTQTLATSYDLSLTSTTIGSQANSYYLNGNISNLRVLKGTALYTANFTPATTNLTAIANTSLLTCQNSTLIDNSTNAFAITSTGDARPLAVSPFTQTTTAVTTTYLGSGYFDGTGDYLSVANAGPLQLGTGNFTIEFWWNGSASGSFTQNIGTLAVNFDAGVYRIGTRYNSTNYVYFARGNGTSFDEITYNVNVNDGAWHHIACVRTSGVIAMYVDGTARTVSAGSASISGTCTFSNPLVIGYNQRDAAYSTGYTSNARIVKGTALYTANFDPPVQPLTAVTNTSLLTLQTNQPAANKQFVDNSGNNFLVTQVGNATQGAFSPYGANWSNFFDGTGDYLTVANSAALGFGTGDYTCEFYMYLTAAPIGNGIKYNLLDFRPSATGVPHTCYVSNSSGTLYLGFYNGSADTTSTSQPIILNTWTHCVWARNSGVLKIFVNGIQAYSATMTSDYLASRSLIVGASAAGTETMFGYMSNLRIVKGTALYTSNFTPSTTPLTPVTNTSLLTCQSPSLIDNSPNAFAITKNGDVNVQRFSPFSPVTQTPQTYSGYFDGTGDYLTFPSNAAFVFGTGDFTIEFWVNQQNWNPSGGAYYSHWISINSYLSGIMVRPNTTGTGIQVYVGGTDYLFSTTLSLNTWFHVAVSRSSSSMRVFVNGTQIGATQTVSYNISTNTSNAIGTAVHDTSEEMQGYLSNLRVLKGTALYTANFTPSTTPLTAIANTSLLTCQSPTFIDNSTNAFAITAVGNTVPRAYNPFGYTLNQGQSYTPALYGSSAYFDGTGDYLNIPNNSNFNQLYSTAVPFTVEFWVYMTVKSADANGIISTYDANGGWRIELHTDGNVYWVSNGANTAIYYAVPLNSWSHLAFVWNGTTIKMYLNGVNVASGATSWTNNSALLLVGHMMTSGIYAFPYFGYIADVRLVKGRAVYTSNFVPPLAPLTAISGTTLLLNMDKGAAVDSSRINDLETVGDAKLRDETPYAGSYYSNYFDGTGDSLTVPDNTAFALGTSNFTIEGWFYLQTLASAAPLIAKSAGTNATSDWAIFINATSGTLRAEATSGSSYIGQCISTVGVTINTWNHFAWVRSGSNFVLYLNGVSVATATSASSAGNGTANLVRLGADNGYSGGTFTGYMSNMRIVKGTAVYTANFTPSTTPLTAVANTSLLTCQSSTFIDNSSNVFTITRNGDVAVKSQNPFRKNSGSSIYFDGTGDRLQIPALNGNINFGTGDFTVEFWVYLITVPTDYPPIITNDNGFYINFRGNGNIALTDVSTTYAQTASALTAGSWFHVAVVRNSGSSKVYVNGTGGTAVACTTNFTNNITTYIGGSPAYVSLNGYISDLRATKSARYTATFTPPTAPLPTS